MKSIFVACFVSTSLPLLLCCSGASITTASVSDSCETSFEKLITKAPVCEDEDFSDFKGDVSNWREACDDTSSSSTKQRLSDAVIASKKCVEDTRQSLAKRKECDEKIALIESKTRCKTAIKCQALIKELTQAITLCESSIKGGFDKEHALMLGDVLKARIEQLKQDRTLNTCRKQCKKAAILASKKITDDTWTAMIVALSQLPPISVEASEQKRTSTAKIESEQERHQEVEYNDAVDNHPNQQSERPNPDSELMEIRELCNATLVKIVEGYLGKVAPLLKDQGNDVDPVKWMAAYDHLSGINARLLEVKADQLAPGTTKKFETILLAVDKHKKEIAIDAKTQEKTLNEETLVRGAKRCRRLTGEISRINGKIAEHSAKNNEAKILAYQKKLVASKRELQNFLMLLKAAIAKKPFDDHQMERLVSGIREAGCSLK